MVKDAEAHAEEDRKFHDLVNARNQADNMIHAVTKSIDELGDKVEAGEKAAAEAAIAALKESLKGDDKDDIDAKTKALAEASAKIAEKAYAQQTESSSGDKGGDGSAGSGGEQDNVVDAEFEEVKEDNK